MQNYLNLSGKNNCMRLKMLLIFCLVFLGGCNSENMQGKTPISIETNEGTIMVFADVVSTPEARAQGLMFREHLEEDFGMWFAFEDPYPYSFWMKNTLIPLDMIFVDENFRIVDIIQADPCQQDPCPLYTPIASAMYVLEVNQNFSARAGVKPGNMVFVG